jgi:hypothetical protein
MRAEGFLEPVTWNTVCKARGIAWSVYVASCQWYISGKRASGHAHAHRPYKESFC